MKLIILLNTASFSKYYINLAFELKKINVEVVFAIDSDFTYDLYYNDIKDFNCFVFNSSKKTKKIKISSKSEASDDTILQSWAMHADFDRGNYYGFNRLFSQGKTVKIIDDLFGFFSYVCDLIEPDGIFYENVSNGFAFIASEVCKKRNLKYIGLTSSRIPNMAFFSVDDYMVSDRIKNKISTINMVEDFNESDINKFMKYLKGINDIQPDYMKNSHINRVSFFSSVFKKISIRSIMVHIKHVFKNDAYFQTGNPLISSSKYRIRSIVRPLKVKCIKHFFSDFKVEPDTKYIIYPTHYHPESSTSLLAKYYDEYSVIKNIAFSLKRGEVLLVKDHISSHGYESYDFYKKISLLPNVILINPEVNVKELLDKCSGVITLTSTVGYEAVLKNKPVVVFGDVFYDFHPLVEKVKSYNELRRHIDYIFNSKDEDYGEYNLKFIASYMSICFYHTINYSDKNNYSGSENLAKLIKKELL